MPLESIIRHLSGISTLTAPGPVREPLDSIIVEVKKIRSNCTESAIAPVIDNIQKALPLFNTLPEKDRQTIKASIKELKIIQQRADYLNNTESRNSFRIPRSIDEFMVRLALPALDLLYRETQRLYPDTLYLPVCQGHLAHLGSSEGECYGFATEGLRGILEENKLFGHTIGDKPIQAAVTRSQTLSCRQTMNANNSVVFNDKINTLQECNRGLGMNFEENYLLTECSKKPEHLFDYINSKGLMGLIFTLATPLAGKKRHALSFIKDSDNRIIALDANSGCYVFKSQEIFKQWLPWYFKNMGYTDFYKTISYNLVSPRTFKNIQEITDLEQKKIQLSIMTREISDLKQAIEKEEKNIPETDFTARFLTTKKKSLLSEKERDLRFKTFGIKETEQRLGMEKELAISTQTLNHNLIRNKKIEDYEKENLRKTPCAIIHNKLKYVALGLSLMRKHIYPGGVVEPSAPSCKS